MQGLGPDVQAKLLQEIFPSFPTNLDQTLRRRRCLYCIRRHNFGSVRAAKSPRRNAERVPGNCVVSFGSPRTQVLDLGHRRIPFQISSPAQFPAGIFASLYERTMQALDAAQDLGLPGGRSRLGKQFSDGRCRVRRSG